MSAASPWPRSRGCSASPGPTWSRLLRGDFREHSLERLLRRLTALGHDIDIVYRRPRSAVGGKLRIAGAEPA